jgi:hypothetical protein
VASRPLRVLAAVAGIALSARPGLPQVRLVPVDTVWLQETAASYLVLPRSLEPDRDGYLVTDSHEAQVVRYASNGRLVRKYGSEGEGPGEFRNAATAVPFGTNEILVVTWKPPALQRFNRETGAYIERYPLQSQPWSVSVSGDTVWLGSLRYDVRAGVERLQLGRSGSTFMASLPESFVEGGPVGGIFHQVSMARWGDTLVVGFEPTETLLVLSPHGAVVERVRIPHVRRRGVPDDLDTHLLDAMRRDYRDVFGVLSALRGVYRLPSGETALIYYDSKPGNLPASSSVFLTLLSPDRTRVCVDAPIPLGPDPHPLVGFKADTLLVLDQQLRTALAVSTFIARFTLDHSACRWISTSIERP